MNLAIDAGAFRHEPAKSAGLDTHAATRSRRSSRTNGPRVGPIGSPRQRGAPAGARLSIGNFRRPPVSKPAEEIRAALAQISRLAIAVFAFLRRRAMIQLTTDMRTRLERLVPFGWMAVGMVFLYILAMLVARDMEWGPIGKSPEKLLPWLMGTEPKILAFYSSPQMIRGEPGTICYGVLNVKSVRLDPAVEQITPSLNRCIAVTPQDTTVYTLYAYGNDGRQLTASFTVAVKPPPPSFLFVSVSSLEVVRGERYAICYGVKNATSVKLEPSMGMVSPPTKKYCMMFYPPVTMEFKLTATGEDGTTETMKIPVKVLDRKKKTTS